MRLLLLPALLVLTACATDTPRKHGAEIVVPTTIAERESYSETYKVPFRYSEDRGIFGTQTMTHSLRVSVNSSNHGRRHYASGGRGEAYPLQVDITYWASYDPRNSINFRADVEQRIGQGYGAETDKSMIMAYASSVAEATLCKGGSVRPNTTEKSVRDPAEIGRMLAMAGGDPMNMLGMKMPADIKQTPTPAIEYGFRGKSTWTVRLRCSLWREV